MKRKQKKKGNSSPETQPESEPVIVEVVSGGNAVPGNTICKDLFFTADRPNVKFKILDTWYEVVVNCPWVVSLALPLSMMSGFPLYPSKVFIHFIIYSWGVHTFCHMGQIRV